MTSHNTIYLLILFPFYSFCQTNIYSIHESDNWDYNIDRFYDDRNDDIPTKVFEVTFTRNKNQSKVDTLVIEVGTIIYSTEDFSNLTQQHFTLSCIRSKYTKDAGKMRKFYYEKNQCYLYKIGLPQNTSMTLVIEAYCDMKGFGTPKQWSSNKLNKKIRFHSGLKSKKVYSVDCKLQQEKYHDTIYNPIIRKDTAILFSTAKIPFLKGQKIISKDLNDMDLLKKKTLAHCNNVIIFTLKERSDIIKLPSGYENGKDKKINPASVVTKDGTKNIYIADDQLPIKLYTSLQTACLDTSELTTISILYQKEYTEKCNTLIELKNIRQLRCVDNSNNMLYYFVEFVADVYHYDELQLIP